MIVVKASYQICQAPAFDVPEMLENFGRVCYKSEEKITPESAEPFCRRLIESQHESVLEHAVMSVGFVVDRGVSHELVRHRIASFSQESTRYVNYHKRGLTFVRPSWLVDGSPVQEVWEQSMLDAESNYESTIAAGCTPEQARAVLPNSVKTEVIMTANFREWRHVLRLRTSTKAHPDMRAVMVPLLAECKERWPVLFGDI